MQRKLPERELMVDSYSGEGKQEGFESTAIIAITTHGVLLALQLQTKLPGSACYVSDRHRFALTMGARGFHRLRDLFPEIWTRYQALICIMATGIVVRVIAPLLKHKTTDPAVIVMDERGHFVISLLSGHWGGANELAILVAQLTGAQPVITTATDIQQKPAWDLIARQVGLEIENMEMLPRLSRALLEDEPVWIYDPENRLDQSTPNIVNAVKVQDLQGLYTEEHRPKLCVWICERQAPAGFKCLQLRPRNLVVGMGCNRGTPRDEILEFLEQVFHREGLSVLSIRNLASIDLKADETGLLEAAKRLQRPISFYSKEAIEAIKVPNPSSVVSSHIGVKSVCEATALLSAQSENLIVPKEKTNNVTVAVAKVVSRS